MKAYAGIDLHSSNSFIGILDQEDRRLYGKRLPNDLESILSALEPFKESLDSVVVESTYNWYWLVDGLQGAGYNVCLANPAAMKQYDGLKHTDDKTDSFWLAKQKQLGILPQGYIYPKEERPIRDLLRRRLLFVRQRTAQLLSLQSMITRNLGIRLSGGKIKTLKKEVLSQIKFKKEFEMLVTTPGIGDILGLTIMLEVGDINRFKKVGNYSSYCRCVKSERRSNDKVKGKGNRKNGNKYLSVLMSVTDALNQGVETDTIGSDPRLDKIRQNNGNSDSVRQKFKADFGLELDEPMTDTIGVTGRSKTNCIRFTLARSWIFPKLSNVSKKRR